MPARPNTQSSLKKDGIVQGTIDYLNNIVVGKIYIEVPEDQEIVQGQEFEADVYSKTSKTKVFMHKTKIEILEPKIQDVDPELGKPEKPEAKPEPNDTDNEETKV